MIAAVKEDLAEYMSRMEKAMDTLKNYRDSMGNGEGDEFYARHGTMSIGNENGAATKRKKATGKDAKFKGKKNCDPCNLI